jgi:predicted nucleic acid-binding protein
VARLIVDTSGYLAGMIKAHPLRPAVREVLAEVDEPPVISPLIMAELDYMVLDRTGVKAETRVLDDLTGGAYDLAEISLDDLRAGHDLIVKYTSLKIGLTDAVNMILAARYRTNEILTLDERHFRAVVPLTPQFAAYRLLPMDQQPGAAGSS